MNLAANLTRNAAAHPDRVAIRLGDDAVTYRDLDESSARSLVCLPVAASGPAQPIAIMLPNVPEFAVAYYGVLRAGGVVVPMNPLLKAREVAYYLGDSGAPVILAWHTTADEVSAGAAPTGAEAVIVEPAAFGDLLAEAAPARGVVDRAADDTAVLLYTSGTTGRPKGAELTHGNLATNVEVTRSDLLEIGPDDVIFGGLPLFHSFGQTCTLNAAVSVGASLSLLPRFDPKQALGLLARASGDRVRRRSHDVQRAAGRTRPRRTTTCRRCGCASPAAPPCRWRCCAQFEKAFGCTGARGLRAVGDLAGRVVQPSRTASASPARSARRSAAWRCGSWTTHGAEVPPGEVGEIAIRGHNIMKGYWDKPEATAEVDLRRRLVPHRRHGPGATRTATTSSSTARRT